MESQRLFKEHTATEQCYALSNPDREYSKGVTLRQKLLQVTSRTMGTKKQGAKLFHSITSQEKDGAKAYFFTFHQALSKEAMSIISGLPAFVKEELHRDPEDFCYPTYINEDHQWLPETRTIKNATVDFLCGLTGLEHTMQEDSEEEDESYDMDEKVTREFRRTVGLDDSETVVDLGEQKKKRSKAVPTQIGSGDSVHSEMSGLTNFSSASKASQHRKELRKTIDDQRLHICLLYTSPSPRDKRQSRMPSSA